MRRPTVQSVQKQLMKWFRKVKLDDNNNYDTNRKEVSVPSQAVRRSSSKRSVVLNIISPSGNGIEQPLHWTQTPDVTKVVPSPMRKPPPPLSAPSLHITIAEPPSMPKRLQHGYSFRLDYGFLQCAQTREHIGLFLIPGNSYQHTYHDLFKYVMSRNRNDPADFGDNLVLHCTNVMTFHKTNCYRVFALVSKGNNSATLLQNQLDKLCVFCHKMMEHAVFDYSNVVDRAVSSNARPNKDNLRTNALFKWLGFEGLKTLVEEVVFTNPISMSTRSPIVVHNGLKIVEMSSGSLLLSSRHCH